MQLTVNGVTHILDRAPTIAELVERLAVTERRLAVEVNRRIVPRSQHATHRLSDGDAVELVQAIGGG
jgi:sulfur carrier protein